MADAQQNVVTVQGPDGQMYDFPKGTDKSAAVAFFKKKGIGVQQQSQSSGAALLSQKRTEGTPHTPKAYGFTPSNMLANFATGVEGAVKGGYEIAKDLVTNPNWFKDTSHDPSQRPSTAQKFVYAPADEQMRKAKENFQNRHLMEATGYFLAANIPILGPVAASLGEQSGKGDIGGAAGQAAGMLAVGKATSMTIDQVTGLAKPEALRQRAADLDTKVLKTAKEGKLNKTDVGLQVANEHIVSSLKELPAKIEQIRAAKNAKVEALAKYHDAKGSVVDAETGLAPTLRVIAQRLNTQGLLTQKVRTSTSTLVKQLTTKWDFRTGKEVPRNLKTLKVSEALELSKGLGKMANWDSDTQAAMEPLVKQARQVINDAIDKVDPEISKTRAEESRLIEARDAADKQYTAMKNDKLATATGIFRSGAPAIGVWLALRGLGLMTPVTALGSVIVLKALAESTLSRTARAALYAKAADLMERTVGAGAAPPQPPTAPGVPQMGGRPTLPAAGQGGPANAGAGQPTQGPPQGGLSAMPPPSAGVSAARPLTLPESATRARAGSGDFVRGPSGAKSTAKLTAAERGVKEGAITPEQGAKETAARDARQVRDKAMLDRLDALYERRSKPKSAMDNSAIQREIKEIKSVLSGEAKGADVSAINKRIADRERLASKRSAAGVVQTGVSQSTSGEAVARQSSPEFRAIALDAGYKALEKYEGGKQMAASLKAAAKAMQRVDPSYDEVEKLTEALQILKSLPPE